jgi:hypothetical protein
MEPVDSFFRRIIVFLRVICFFTILELHIGYKGPHHFDTAQPVHSSQATDRFCWHLCRCRPQTHTERKFCTARFSWILIIISFPSVSSPILLSTWTSCRQFISAPDSWEIFWELDKFRLNLPWATCPHPDFEHYYRDRYHSWSHGSDPAGDMTDAYSDRFICDDIIVVSFRWVRTVCLMQVSWWHGTQFTDAYAFRPRLSSPLCAISGNNCGNNLIYLRVLKLMICKFPYLSSLFWLFTEQSPEKEWVLVARDAVVSFVVAFTFRVLHMAGHGIEGKCTLLNSINSH